MQQFLQIFEYIGYPFGLAFKGIYGFTGHYLTALLLFGICIKLIMLPLSIRQHKNTVTRALLAPQEKVIRDKYKGKTDEASQMAMNKQLMTLYTTSGQNPLTGCLPMLIQMPIMFSLYAIITKPLTYISGMEASAIAAIETRLHEVLQASAPLTQIQMVSYLKENAVAFADLIRGITLPEFTILSGAIDLSQTPSFTQLSWLLLIPLLTLILSYISQMLRKKLNPMEMSVSGDVGKGMQAMEYIGPIMSVWISFSVPAIIGIYWMMQSALDVAQQIILSKRYPLAVAVTNNLGQSIPGNSLSTSAEGRKNDALL